MRSPLFRFGGLSVHQVVRSARVFEGSRLESSTQGGVRRLAGQGLYSGVLDVSYLKFCSEAYDISDDPRDYVIVDLPIVESDVPNRNMDAFGALELTSWNAVAKSPVWRTFQWAPSFQDHVNQDPKAAKGVLFDASYLRAGPGWNVRILWGCDRSKDQKLAAAIMSGKRNAYSMGALASFVSCSCHGRVYDGNPANGCENIRAGKKGEIINMAGRGDVLCHDSCHGVNFVEASSVEDPAFYGAQSDLVLSTPR